MSEARQFQFTQGYTREELVECGEEFCRLLNDLDPANVESLTNGEWTELVLDWFAATAPEEVLVDAKPPRTRVSKAYVDARKQLGVDRGLRRTHGEFLVDLCHSNFPTYEIDRPFYSDEYWAKVAEAPREVYLALESEWGKANSAKANRHRVLEDAAKLPFFNARAKVLVFGSSSAGARGEIVSSVTRLRSTCGDDKPWLLVDVPWDEQARSLVLNGA